MGEKEWWWWWWWRWWGWGVDFVLIHPIHWHLCYRMQVGWWVVSRQSLQQPPTPTIFLPQAMLCSLCHQFSFFSTWGPVCRLEKRERKYTLPWYRAVIGSQCPAPFPWKNRGEGTALCFFEGVRSCTHVIHRRSMDIFWINIVKWRIQGRSFKSIISSCLLLLYYLLLSDET